MRKRVHAHNVKDEQQKSGLREQTGRRPRSARR